MRRRRGDGCPVAGMLQVVGDRWTLLVVRDLARAPRRTTDLLAALHPISSRTLLARLRELEHDRLVERRDYGGSPPHVEYALTERGRVLLPLVDLLRTLGEQLGCADCAGRKARRGDYCDTCPQRAPAPQTSRRPRPRDDSIVLL
ncbi:MAG TPA: helix-turn-helix domain-containing protein [Pyrinomonadaceae bacterium]